MHIAYELSAARSPASLIRVRERRPGRSALLSQIASAIAQRFADQRRRAIIIYRVPPIGRSRRRLIYGVRRPISCVAGRQVKARPSSIKGRGDAL